MSYLQEWADKITNGASLRTIAKELNANHATISRRLAGNDPALVVELARAYNHNPIEGLLGIGFITQRDIDAYSHSAALDDYSDLELAQAIVTRIQERGSDTLENVTEFPTADVDPLPYAANRRQPEPEEGDDDYGSGA